MNHAHPADILAHPARTSALAVASLVFGILCLPPGTGLIAVVLGIAALLRIDRSAGRLRGAGFAVGGVVLGFLASLIWIGVVIGVGQVSGATRKYLMQPIVAALESAQRGDAAPLRAMLDPAVRDAATDERVHAFRAEYEALTGGFVAAPDSVLDMFWASLDSYTAGRKRKIVPGEPVVWPVPLEFSKGPALVLTELAPGDHKLPAKGPWVPPLTNFGIGTLDGQEVWLLPRAGAPASAPAPASPHGLPSAPDDGAPDGG